jgi:hypothetical protein
MTTSSASFREFWRGQESLREREEGLFIDSPLLKETTLLEVIAVPKWNSVLQQVSWLFPKKNR